MSLQLVDWVVTTFDTKPSLPEQAVMIANDGFRFAVADRMDELFHLASCFGEGICSFIPLYSTVRRHPLQGHCCLL